MTYEENAKREDVMEDLKTHIEMVNRLPRQVQQNETQMIEADTARITAETAKIAAGTTPNPDNERTNRKFNAKRDAIPRPMVEENSSESDWSFFLAQLKRYTMG